MRKWILIAALAVAGFAGSEARADGPFPFPSKGQFSNQPYANSIGHGINNRPVLAHIFHVQGPVLPVYQAAPWYLYFPYDAHFQTPAPVYGQPGGYGMGNPYFPYNPYPMSFGRP